MKLTNNQHFVVLSCKSCQNNARKYNTFLQNEPNFKIIHIYTSVFNRTGYGNFPHLFLRKNEPKRTQNEPNFSPKLGLFFPKLALIYNKIVTLAHILRGWSAGSKVEKADLLSKIAEHSCGRRICRLIINLYSLTYRYKRLYRLCGRIKIFVESLLSLEYFYENTKVSKTNPCKSVKSAVKYRLVRSLTGVGIVNRLANVEKTNKKPVIGILGGIGAGKSTTAAEFERLGCGLIDADKIAHQLLDEPEIKQKIIETFGSTILDTNNKIGRKKLADIVFADKDKLTQLNNIIHPAVLERANELIEEFNNRPEVKAIVLDMPLLVEVGWEKMCERIIFIDCKAEKRAERSKKTHLFDENQLKIRENLQISLDKKQAIAENTIDNNSELQTLKRQVAEIFSNIVENNWGLL